MKERFELNRAKLMSVLKRNQKKEIQTLAIMLDESDSTQITGMCGQKANSVDLAFSRLM